MMSSFPSSSLIRAASGIPLIATPSTESASICRFSSSSSAMSDIAAAMNPMRFPYTPTDRHPIFTSFGGSPPLMPRVRSQVTVSGDRCNSSAISFSQSTFSLYSIHRLAIEFVDQRACVADADPALHVPFKARLNRDLALPREAHDALHHPLRTAGQDLVELLPTEELLRKGRHESREAAGAVVGGDVHLPRGVRSLDEQ